jgi:hypothetical protein
MHVVEKFSSSIFSNNADVTSHRRINQMPMPVVKVDTKIFTEVPEAISRINFNIRSSILLNLTHACSGSLSEAV